HVALLQVLESIQHFRQRQAELGPEAGAIAPAAGAARGQLHADADERTHLEFLGMLHNRFQLGKLLDDGDDLLADLACQHRHLDEFIILETVAYDGRLQAVGLSQDGKQFRLGTCFQAEIKWLAEIENFLNDVALLVDLDGIHTAVFALIAKLSNGVFEGLVDLAHPVAEDVGKAQQDRQLDAAGLDLIDQLLQVNGAILTLVGMNGDVAERIDAK